MKTTHSLFAIALLFSCITPREIEYNKVYRQKQPNLSIIFFNDSICRVESSYPSFYPIAYGSYTLEGGNILVDLTTITEYEQIQIFTIDTVRNEKTTLWFIGADGKHNFNPLEITVYKDGVENAHAWPPSLFIYQGMTYITNLADSFQIDVDGVISNTFALPDSMKGRTFKLVIPYYYKGFWYGEKFSIERRGLIPDAKFKIDELDSIIYQRE